jgi:uncharacterized cupredoxin-like copper-binding protein
MLLFAITMLLLSLLTGCGSGGLLGTPAPPSIDVTINADSMTLSSSTFTGTELLLRVQNATDVPQNFVVVQTDEPLDALETDEDGNASLSGLNVVALIEAVGPQSSEEITVQLASGRYILIANINGGYTAGARAELNVTAPETPTPPPP